MEEHLRGFIPLVVVIAVVQVVVACGEAAPEAWGSEIQRQYTATRYHAPSDEYSEDFVFDGAVQQGALVLSVLLDIAGDDTWPEWHDGQEFKAARDAMMSGR